MIHQFLGRADGITPARVATGMVTANPRASPDLIPVGRFGTPEEAAEVAVVLATSGSVTGQTVNSGWYMN